MSKLVGLAAIMASLFPKSNQPLSEKLSTEEYNGLTAEVAELNERLVAQATGNAQVVTDLATANASVTELTGKLEASTKQVTGLDVQVVSLTTERDQYKAYHEKAVKAGTANANTDANSQRAELASYNQHAIEVFQEMHS